jgi:hypothetical protein
MPLEARMKPPRSALPAATLLAAAVLLPASPAAAQVSDAELAMRWAPVHYQDTDSSDYDADFLSAVDYDGEWDTLNNWDHQDDGVHPLAGTGYYSVVETSSHWFIGYAFYHPRDWIDVPDPFNLFHHENDLEGLLLAVRRDGSAFGALEAMVTVSHGDFFSYVAPGSPYTSGRESVDGTIVMRTVDGVARPTSWQEAKGHGLRRWNGAEFAGGDGIIYLPGTGEVPGGGNDRSVGYRLVSVFAEDGLWARRNSSTTFASFGTFRGDNGQDNAANAPWGWDDGDDGSDLPRGLLATDPARLVGAYFNGEAPFSLAYTRNPYAGG